MSKDRNYYSHLRPLLFQVEAERIHSLTLGLLRLLGGLAPLGFVIRKWFEPPQRPVEAFGLVFKNPVGLAAGYDKDGLAWKGLACLGFGHIEIGTVTLKPQDGNPRPRLFRLPDDQGLINRMGFPGRGASFVARRIREWNPSAHVAKDPLARLILGVNLGKNKDTPLEEAARDYQALLQVFAPLADYLVINVSSPNTIGLRRLQARIALEGLLKHLMQERSTQQSRLGRRVPMLVKLAPDLTDAELDDALEAITQTGADGVVATNTTLDRPNLRSPMASEAGGLSGLPLREKSTQMIRKISQRTAGSLPIIGVGGVQSAAEAREKLDAGAVLVQVYTGLIYAGPGIVKQIVSGL